MGYVKPMDLVAKNLGCARGGVPVLAGVRFRLSPGQVLVLRGPNGVGKTTLLRVVAGLQPAVSGRISGPEVAYAGHADGVKATLSVRENLRFWAAVYGQGGVDGAMDAMQLSGLSDRAGGSLSAGQRRRLGLARLMVTGRRIWVLDEPTVSLDTASVMLFAEMLRGHLAGGGSALIATHIDVGLPGAIELDLTPFRARATAEMPGFA
jgi:heme exporter protein A